MPLSHLKLDLYKVVSCCIQFKAGFLPPRSFLPSNCKASSLPIRKLHRFLMPKVSSLTTCTGKLSSFQPGIYFSFYRKTLQHWCTYSLYARYLCSRDALGLKAKQPVGQARRATIGYLVYKPIVQIGGW